MNIAHPSQAISPTIDTALLIELSGSREARSGRRLATAIGRSRTGVQHVLNRLVTEGLVERSEAGSAFLYSFNHDHLLARAVEEMAGARGELVTRLRGSVGGWDVQPAHLSLFGSAARGDGDTESDIDLFLVRPRSVAEDDDGWRESVDDLADSVERWTGNRAGIVELGERELPALRKRRPPVLRDLGRDGVDLAGKPLRKLLGKQG